jgi:hypothetical protein
MPLKMTNCFEIYQNLPFKILQKSDFWYKNILSGNHGLVIVCQAKNLLKNGVCLEAVIHTFVIFKSPDDHNYLCTEIRRA